MSPTPVTVSARPGHPASSRHLPGQLNLIEDRRKRLPGLLRVTVGRKETSAKRIFSSRNPEKHLSFVVKTENDVVVQVFTKTYRDHHRCVVVSRGKEDVDKYGGVLRSRDKVLRRMSHRLCCMWMYLVIVSFMVCSVSSQEKRCICSLKDSTEIKTYDHEKLYLPLPCHYRLTSIKTRNGRCHITADLAMTAKDASKTTPAGLRYLVSQDGAVTGGFIDSRGVIPIDLNKQSRKPLNLPEFVLQDGVEVLAYQDESQSYKLSLTQCKVTLYYKPGRYLGVYSHNFSKFYKYNMWDLCGDCDGSRNEAEAKLPPEIKGSVRTLKERDAAMLYMASMHISGGSRKCYDYRTMIGACHKPTLLKALSICGQLFAPKSPLVKCLSSRTYMGKVLDTYSQCVRMFCVGNSKQGCRYLRDLASITFCRLPKSTQESCDSLL